MRPIAWRISTLGILLAASCVDETGSVRPRPDVAGEHSGTFAPASPPLTSPAMSLSPTRALAARAEHHLLNYGSWDPAEIATAQAHDVVVVDPRDVTRAEVAAIQTGGDHRVIVLGYVSIGEDIRTVGLSDAEMLADPRFVGDGTGPRVDPRGPDADGDPLTGIPLGGAPSPGGDGYASWYLDDNDVDGRPDRNGNFDGAFVNAGDPAWFDALQDMTADGPDRVPGLREILTTSYGRGLGCDGVFLDTLDTAAPNSWTDDSSSNPTEFEWTAPGFAAFLGRLRATYPDVVVLQNRGLFFFDPRNPQFDFIPRGQLDFVLYESYRLNSGATDNPDPYHYPNNRFNYAPKLMAEANRSDGFRVLSLGYAEGPPDQMAEATLVGGSSLGFESLLEDIRVTEELAGFRHYLSNSHVTLVNRFVMDHADRTDASPPVWTSTWNDQSSYPEPPGQPTPRPGIQEVLVGDGGVTVRWDVAQDLNRVGYALYHDGNRVVLDGRPTAAYAEGVGPGVYANEATVPLPPGEHHLMIRAFDPAGHEDGNQVMLTATVGGEPGPYLGRWRASNGVSSLTYRFQYTGTWSWRHVWIDRDRMPGTGYAYRGVGADLLIEEGRLYRYAGNGSSWAWTYLGPVAMTTGTIDGTSWVQWDLEQADLESGTRHTQVVFQLQSPGESLASTVYQHVYTTSDPSSPYLETYVENDADRIYLHAEIHAPFTYRHVFLDDDADPTTGYPFGGVGAGYLIENGRLYRHAGPGWTWVRVGDAGEVVTGASHHWTIARADVGAAGGSPRFDVVFQANGGAPTYVAPVYVHAFSR